MSAAGEINKCIINGETVYTDEQCPENTSQSFELNRINLMSSEPSEYKSTKVKRSGYQSGRWYNDHSGYKEALTVSRKRKAPILIYGRTDWCPYCKRLDSTFASNAEIKKVLSRFVKVKLNPDHGSKDEKLFKSWGGTGYPTLFVQSGKGSKPRKIRRPSTSKDDKEKERRNEAFISKLQEELDSYGK